MNNFIKTFLIIFTVLINASSNAQKQDSLTVVRKNIFKLNLTSSYLYQNAILIQYERLLKNNQSISLQAGYVTLPFVTHDDSLKLTSDLEKSGYSILADYRFYLKKENKNPAPHGIYLAPFSSFNHFDNKRTLQRESNSGSVETLTLDSKIELFSIGIGMGYQFVLGKRWVLDFMLVGPSLTNYHVEMQMAGDLTQVELDETMKEILSALSNRFPLIGNLLDDDIAEFNGKASVWSTGYRYSIHAGFLF